MASTTPLPASPQINAALPDIEDVPEIAAERQRDSGDDTKDQASVSAPAPALVQFDSTPDPPPSVFSADTAATQASWIASLMGWKSQQPLSQPPTESSASDSRLTQSEQIKEEALARDQAPPDPPKSPAMAASEPSPIITPDTRASWVSFFSSRSRATIKAIDNGETDMEVMDIEDDGPPAPTVKPAASPVKTPTSPTKAKTTETPSAAPATPLTDSKQIKKKVSEARRASKDSTKKDRPPRLPNLVLPTWGDTFYASPRVHAPPQAGTLKKTINAVSRFWTTPILNPEIEEYRQERKKRYGDESHRNADEGHKRIIRSIGRDLPRVWSVLGDTSSGVDMAGVKRVVVIGVHG